MEHMPPAPHAAARPPLIFEHFKAACCGCTQAEAASTAPAQCAAKLSYSHTVAALPQIANASADKPRPLHMHHEKGGGRCYASGSAHQWQSIPALQLRLLAMPHEISFGAQPAPPAVLLRGACRLASDGCSAEAKNNCKDGGSRSTSHTEIKEHRRGLGEGQEVLGAGSSCSPAATGVWILL